VLFAGSVAHEVGGTTTDIIGSYVPIISIIGSYAPIIDIVGSYVPTIDIVGEYDGD
jgi:hypothetical protein